jgi:DUF3037 family protein
MTYFFSMLRFVPDPARGEFINIGAIAGDDHAADWEMRLISNLSRARAIDAGALLPRAMAVLGDLQERLTTEDVPEPRAGWLSWPELRALSGEMNNLLQLSAPAPVVAGSAQEALDLVFEELVLDPASRRFRFEKKHRAVRVTREAYRLAEVPDSYVKERVLVTSGAFQSPFDFAVQNGRVVQLVQCWSFQLPNQQELAEQVKAWAWTVRELRLNGGTVRADGIDVAAPRQLDVAAMYIPPLANAAAPAFLEAQAAFEEIAVQQFTPERAGTLAQHAADALHAAR